MGAAGSTVDISAGGNHLPSAALPKPAALSTSKMIAFRAVGVTGYKWPPEQCKAQAETVGKNCWFCPSTGKCAQSERECRGVVPARWGDSKLGTKEAHQIPAEPQQHIVAVNQHIVAVNQLEVYISGKKVKRDVPIKVIEDACLIICLLALKNHICLFGKFEYTKE